MAWDFCSTYRALLRLPPFPLARLEMAFRDAAPSDVTFPLGPSSGAEAAPNEAPVPNQASPELPDLAVNMNGAATAAEPPSRPPSAGAGMLSVSAGGGQP